MLLLLLTLIVGLSKWLLRTLWRIYILSQISRRGNLLTRCLDIEWLRICLQWACWRCLKVRLSQILLLLMLLLWLIVASELLLLHILLLVGVVACVLLVHLVLLLMHLLPLNVLVLLTLRERLGECLPIRRNHHAYAFLRRISCLSIGLYRDFGYLILVFPFALAKLFSCLIGAYWILKFLFLGKLWGACLVRLHWPVDLTLLFTAFTLSGFILWSNWCLLDSCCGRALVNVGIVSCRQTAKHFWNRGIAPCNRLALLGLWLRRLRRLRCQMLLLLLLYLLCQRFLFLRLLGIWLVGHIFLLFCLTWLSGLSRADFRAGCLHLCRLRGFLVYSYSFFYWLSSCGCLIDRLFVFGWLLILWLLAGDCLATKDCLEHTLIGAKVVGWSLFGLSFGLFLLLCLLLFFSIRWGLGWEFSLSRVACLCSVTL